jgi:hypothetical protein
MAAYLADPCPEPSLSSSAAFKLITRSPRHVYATHPRFQGERGDDSSIADIGSVAHDLLLGGEGKIAELDFPDWRTNASKEARDRARADGLTPILSHRMPTVRAMVEAAREFVATSEIAGAFDSGAAEQTVIWREGESWCRCRPDWLNDRIALHVKTTDASARPEPFIRGIMQNMGYGFATRFYDRGLKAVGRHVSHVLLVIEQNFPHACSLISLTPAKSAVEDARVERAIRLWAQCMATNTWPGYDNRIHYAEPTGWELAEHEAQEAA